MNANFFTLIHTTLTTSPDQVLVVWPALPDGTAPATFTGRELLLRIEAARAELSARDLRPGQQVLLALPLSIHLICTLLAVMSMGAIPVLPPAGSSPLGLLQLARRCGLHQAVLGKSAAVGTRLLARLFGLRLSAVGAASLSGAAPAWLPSLCRRINRP